ncbi:PepSY domain-containing protein [Paenisporosarcina sp.]|uniref:PepSY domain-containing protein n=1 Tax=Paenisporosarcina sp. TaxID=1932001 RepID=UPI003C74626F
MKNKWMTVPIVAGALVLGSVAMVAGANQNLDQASVNGKEKTSILTNEEITEKALAKVDGTVTEVELERKLSGSVYEVEIKKDGYEYDLDLDAVTGEVIKEDKSKDDDEAGLDDNSTKSDSSDVAITHEAAIEIALKEAAGTVTEIELERDNGRTYYEIELEEGNKEVDIEVDANSGAVLSVVKDDDDDSDDDNEE